MSADLNELSRLLEQATPGPWFVYVHTGDCTTIGPGDDWTIYGKDREAVVYEGVSSEHSAANAALIAALRNHADALIRDARRYRKLRQPEEQCSWDDIGVVTLLIGGDYERPESEALDAAIDAAIAQEQP